MKWTSVPSLLLGLEAKHYFPECLLLLLLPFTYVKVTSGTRNSRKSIRCQDFYMSHFIVECVCDIWLAVCCHVCISFSNWSVMKPAATPTCRNNISVYSMQLSAFCSCFALKQNLSRLCEVICFFFCFDPTEV